MSTTLDALKKECLRLSESERAKLAFELLKSLNGTTREENILDTVRRRAAELDSGQVQPIPSEEVFRKARDLLS